MTDTCKVPDSSVDYKEEKNNLAIRIEAHKRFSNFSLEDWLNEHLPFKNGNVILDIGCGDGNLFGCYSSKLGNRGIIVGVDKSKELLATASRRKNTTPATLLEWDMNMRFPFIEESFNYVISTFAIYYVNDVRGVVDEIERVLKPSGEVFLIGPTDNNAKELYEFNKMIFGIERSQKVARRTNRIEQEFYQVAQTVFRDVSVEKIPSKLIFPNKEEFLKYYRATLLFEESLRESGFNADIEKINSIDIPTTFEISKEMIVLRGRNHE